MSGKRLTRAASVFALLAIAGLALAGCDRPGTHVASGEPAAAGTDVPSPSISTATPDRASPAAPASATLAPGNRGIASGALGETVTTGKIKAAIAADSGMKDSDVSVSTDKGVVTLSGTVKSQDQITIATNLAQRQEGVTRVESNLTVK